MGTDLIPLRRGPIEGVRQVRDWLQAQVASPHWCEDDEVAQRRRGVQVQRSARIVHVQMAIPTRQVMGLWTRVVAVEDDSTRGIPVITRRQVLVIDLPVTTNAIVSAHSAMAQEVRMQADASGHRGIALIE
ncbi:hypothetical protein D3C79_714510 [compost metagenome]